MDKLIFLELYFSLSLSLQNWLNDTKIELENMASNYFISNCKNPYYFGWESSNVTQ